MIPLQPFPQCVSFLAYPAITHLISSLCFFLDYHLLGPPFPKLFHPWTSLLWKLLMSSCKLSWSSLPTAQNWIPHLSAQIFLSVVDLNEICFLLPPKSTLFMVRHWQPPRTREDIMLCCVQLAPSPRSMALLVSIPPLSCARLWRNKEMKK